MYREAERIGSTVATLAAWLEGRDDVELVFVDDGSDDRTIPVLRDVLAARRAVVATPQRARVPPRRRAAA